jgi:hypothetical protein
MRPPAQAITSLGSKRRMTTASLGLLEVAEGQRSKADPLFTTRCNFFKTLTQSKLTQRKGLIPYGYA